MNDAISILGQQIPVALVLVYFQNFLKRQKWFPLITYQSTKMNHAFAIIASGVATFGFHFAHTGSITTGGTFTIAFPSLAVLLASLWHWLTQYILAKTGYTALQSQLNPPGAQQPSPVVVVPQSKPISPVSEIPGVLTPDIKRG